MTTDGAPPVHVVGGFDRAGRRWVVSLFGGGGVALGAVLPVLVGWAVELPWVPFQGPLRLIATFDQSWLTWGRPVLGLLLGLGAAAWVIADAHVLEVGPDEIQVRRRGEVQRVIQHATVASVHPKGSKVVIETETGRTLFEGEIEGDKAAVRRAFVETGYPWAGPRE